MTVKRVSKSTVDWSKISSLFKKTEQSEFLKLKAKSEACLRKVAAYPERPPQIDFNEIRSRVVNKSAVDSLEKAYKALEIKFPSDNNIGQEITVQETEHKEKGQMLVSQIRAETKEANELLQKFEDMIPVDQMHSEEFIQTFPDWNDTPQNPALDPRNERRPGHSKKEYDEISKGYF